MELQLLFGSGEESLRERTAAVLKSFSFPIYPNVGEPAPDQMHISSAMMEQIQVAGLLESEVLAVGHHVQGCAPCRQRLRGLVARPEPQSISVAEWRPLIALPAGF